MKDVYTIFSPHNPFLISKVGKEHSEKLKKSITSWKYIRQKIYSVDPKKIIIILPQYNKFNNISINQCDDYVVNFKEFGDLSLEFQISGDLDFSTKLKYYLRENDFNVSVFSNREINYKAFVPLYYLNKYHTNSKGFKNEMKHEPNDTEFVFINCSMADFHYHIKFGKLLSKFIESYDSRVVVVSCGDFVKDVNQESFTEAEKLLEEFINSVKKKKYDNIFQFEDEFKKADYAGVKPFIVVSQILKDQKLAHNILSLEKAFNEIYLTCEFE